MKSKILDEPYKNDPIIKKYINKHIAGELTWEEAMTICVYELYKEKQKKKNDIS